MSATLRIPPPGLLQLTIKGNQYDMTATTTMEDTSGFITNLIAGMIVIWYAARMGRPGEVLADNKKPLTLNRVGGLFFM